MAQRVIFGSLFAVAGLALLGLSSQASATTILDTTNGFPFLGTPSSGEAIQFTTSPGQSLAITFSLSSPATIQSVEAYIFQVSPGANVILGIMSNNTGTNLPSGTFLDAFIVAPGTGPVDRTSLSWSLGSGTYWLAALAVTGASLEWQTEGGLSVNYAAGDGTGHNWSLTPGGLSDLEPMALITGAETPLPAALPLFATGIGGLGLLGWRRKRKAQAVA